MAIANILGTLHFCSILTKGFNKKYKNPDIMIGKNSVVKKTTTGSNKNVIFEDRYNMVTIINS